MTLRRAHVATLLHNISTWHTKFLYCRACKEGLAEMLGSLRKTTGSHNAKMRKRAADLHHAA